MAPALHLRGRDIAHRPVFVPAPTVRASIPAPAIASRAESPAHRSVEQVRQGLSPVALHSAWPARTAVAAASPHPWPELATARPTPQDRPNTEAVVRRIARARRLAVEESLV
ncbi:hypothetical protein GY21_14065 [Cryobacterium roopkundense]|uniref:Uncharacterized protein n=1 Tax=Cryobacterium roopkundense TaxID=1001240 RepID=A0A099J573_9MICO|nr:hypothetical protein GY21_14065 [Cryobacterium roopkundense]